MKHQPCSQCRGSEDVQFTSEPDEVFYAHAVADEPLEYASCVGGADTKPHYQELSLPEGAVYAASSPIMTETSILPGILKKHMAPRGKCARLVVKSGTLQFVWEDTGEVFDATPEHPIIIAPERYHHVRLTGPVVFHLDFYTLPATAGTVDPAAARPGEQFL